jgi:hypothetical protein
MFWAWVSLVRFFSVCWSRSQNAVKERHEARVGKKSNVVQASFESDWTCQMTDYNLALLMEIDCEMFIQGAPPVRNPSSEIVWHVWNREYQRCLSGIDWDSNGLDGIPWRRVLSILREPGSRAMHIWYTLSTRCPWFPVKSRSVERDWEWLRATLPTPTDVNQKSGLEQMRIGSESLRNVEKC